MILISSKCSELDSADVSILSSSDFKFAYNLNEPNSSFLLDSNLKEISGIECSIDDQILYAVNDEKADLYSLDILTGEVVQKIDFGKPDDYEGLCMVDDLIYIVESNGNLKVVNPKSGKRVATYDCRLSKKHNIEGLAYHASSKSLLLAAKGNSKLDGHKKGNRSVFSISTSNYKASKKPYLSLDLKEQAQNLVSGLKNVDGLDKLMRRVSDFAPSGLAFHPITNDLYILSARGQTLTVTNSNGDVNSVVFLKQSNNPQPEGICFKSDGTLFISNEGVVGKGKIDVFQML